MWILGQTKRFCHFCTICSLKGQDFVLGLLSPKRVIVLNSKFRRRRISMECLISSRLLRGLELEPYLRSSYWEKHGLRLKRVSQCEPRKRPFGWKTTATTTIATTHKRNVSQMETEASSEIGGHNSNWEQQGEESSQSERRNRSSALLSFL